MSANRIHADQIDTDEPLVRRLVAAQFPRWADLPVARVPSTGTENAIYRLGDELAVRLPYRPVKDEQIDKLERWLPRLAPELPLAIPEPIARGARARSSRSRGRSCAGSTARRSGWTGSRIRSAPRARSRSSSARS